MSLNHLPEKHKTSECIDIRVCTWIKPLIFAVIDMGLLVEIAMEL